MIRRPVAGAADAVVQRGRGLTLPLPAGTANYRGRAGGAAAENLAADHRARACTTPNAQRTLTMSYSTLDASTTRHCLNE